MRKIFFTCILCSVVTALFLPGACSDDMGIPRLDDGDYLIFGTYYGMCAGDCVEFYKLGKDKLSENERKGNPVAYVPDGFYAGEFVSMTQAQFEAAKDLRTYFPAGLLEEDDVFIGCPDCADGGGIYVEYNVGGVRKYWKIDATKYDVPKKYHSFIDKVKEKVDLLKKTK